MVGWLELGAAVEKEPKECELVAVGDAVGEAVGAADVGQRVGPPLVGDAEGTAVGTVDDGLAVGNTVGSEVAGDVEGDAVGAVSVRHTSKETGPHRRVGEFTVPYASRSMKVVPAGSRRKKV